MKKFITIILSIIMTICLFGATALLIFKDIASANTIEKIVEEIADTNTKEFMVDMLDDMEDDEEFQDSIKYLDNEEFVDALSEYLSTGLKYASTGKGKIPDSSKLEDTVIDAAKKYEKETGKDVDIQAIRDSFDELDNSFEEFEEEFIENDSVRNALSIAYGTAYIAPLFVIAVILTIIFLMFKDIKPVLKSLSISLIVVGTFYGLIGLIVNAALKVEPNFAGFGAIISGVIIKHAVICIIIAIVSLIVRTILKRRIKEEKESI